MTAAYVQARAKGGGASGYARGFQHPALAVAPSLETGRRRWQALKGATLTLIAVLIFTAGLFALLLGLVGVIKPIVRLHMTTRKHALAWAGCGLAAMIFALAASPDKPKHAVTGASPSGPVQADERPPAVRDAARREAAESKANWTEGRQLLIGCKVQMQADKGDFADCEKGIAMFSSLPRDSSCRMQFDQVERYVSERTAGNADPHLYDMAAIHYDGCLAEIDSFIVYAERELSQTH